MRLTDSIPYQEKNSFGAMSQTRFVIGEETPSSTSGQPPPFGGMRNNNQISHVGPLIGH